MNDKTREAMDRLNSTSQLPIADPTPAIAGGTVPPATPGTPTPGRASGGPSGPPASSPSEGDNTAADTPAAAPPPMDSSAPATRTSMTPGDIAEIATVADPAAGAPPAPPLRNATLPPDDDHTLDGLDLIRRFIELDDIRKDLEGVCKTAAGRIDDMRERIADWFAEQDVDQIRVAGFTVYLHRQLWVGYAKPDTDGMSKEDAAAAKAAAKAMLIEAMMETQWDVPDPDDPTRPPRRVSLAHLVHPDFNSQSLSSMIRELPVDDAGTPMIPEDLKSLMSISYDVKPRKRRSR